MLFIARAVVDFSLEVKELKDNGEIVFSHKVVEPEVGEQFASLQDRYEYKCKETMGNILLEWWSYDFNYTCLENLEQNLIARFWNDCPYTLWNLISVIDNGEEEKREVNC